MGIEQRYANVAAEVAAVCREAGRDPTEVTVVAVSKTVGPDAVARALAAGARDFGENRPDGLAEKAAAFPQATWHFIGNIQSRRIPDIVRSAALVHSLFEERHARKIDEAATAAGCSTASSRSWASLTRRRHASSGAKQGQTEKRSRVNAAAARPPEPNEAGGEHGAAQNQAIRARRRDARRHQVEAGLR